jgi:hypothetical protein
VHCSSSGRREKNLHRDGEFTPAHVIGRTAVFIPQAFDLTFEFTPTGGSTDTETDTSSKHNAHGELVT